MEEMRSRVARYALGMNDTLNLTIVYEPGDDGWITVSIPEVPGVLSQGRTRKEAREERHRRTCTHALARAQRR